MASKSSSHNYSNQNKLIVSKFGGTSMGDAACMLRSAEVSVNQNSFLVCVSATSGTTNQLIAIGQTSASGDAEKASYLINECIHKHSQIARDLELHDLSQLELLFVEMHSIAKGMELLKDCSPRAMDILVSLGERMSSVLFTQAMRNVLKSKGISSEVILVDAREIITTDDQYGKAKPDIRRIAENCQKVILANYQPGRHVLITQGYIGRSFSGHSTTLGRGGSDYSAALFAEGLNAAELEIWTDVPGIATTDPRICSQAKSIAEISFKEASEMAIFGAKVLHPATVEPAMRKNIPVFVGSSFDAHLKGTWVRKEVTDAPLMRALALRKNQSLVTLSTPEMLQTHGFLFKIFKVFNDFKISIDAITTSEISVSVTIDGEIKSNTALIEELQQFADVLIEDGLSLVSLIGNNINHTPGLAKKIFSAIEDINVRMICLGASKHNFCFLVDSSFGEKAIQRLHAEFIH
ncbi:MAG: lysine-sensitive aspartokinase 3 [Pseudobdellovibrio sp.]